ncbi:AI-2E family transporter [Roseomonas sp. CCTCC AB2023176]|uniref:AI-2E family transporter n=1 Tax=Roseomonas sp. CCTCC AB2023176 TaxID=3342640 RepID=UPI0035DDA304
MTEERSSATRIVGLVLLTGLLVGCFLVLRPFLSALAWAAILSFTTWPAFRLLRERTGLSATWAAVVMVTAMMVLIGLPLALATPTSREDVQGLRAAIEALITHGMPGMGDTLGRVPWIGGYLREWFEGLDLGFSALFDMARPYAGGVAQWLLGMLLAILSGVAELLLAILLSFFFYRDGPRIAQVLEDMAEKIAGGRGRRLLVLTGAVTQGVVYGLLGTAVVQGVMTSFGLWVAGVPRPVLWGVVAGIISILPVGAPLVWIPAAIWLFVNDSPGWGVFMLVYGAAGISSVDNFIRPWLIARGADLPLLLTILGALGGAFAFGFLGLFLGPVLLAVAYTVVKDWASDGATRTHRQVV